MNRIGAGGTGSARGVRDAHLGRASRTASLLALSMLAGCMTLRDDLRSSIELVGMCRMLEQDRAQVLALSPAQFGQQLRSRLLAETYCVGEEGGLEQQPLMQCAVDELVRGAKAAYGESSSKFSEIRKSRRVFTEQITAVQKHASNLQVRLQSECGRSFGSAGDLSRCYLTLVNGDSPQNRRTVAVELGGMIAALDRMAAEVVAMQAKLAIVAAEANHAHVAFAEEVLRFAESAHAFLRQARAAALGDVNAATASALLASTVYQRAYRIFDLLDHGLMPVEALLDRADQQLYGTVSLSMFVFRSDLEGLMSFAARRS